MTTLYLVKLNKEGQAPVIKIGVAADVDARLRRTGYMEQYAEEFAATNKVKMSDFFDSYKILKTVELDREAAFYHENKIKERHPRDFYHNIFIDGITEMRKYDEQLVRDVMYYMNKIEETL